MKRRKGNLRYYLREGISNITVHGFMSFAAVTVMAACLLITGSFALVAYNIGVKITEMESQNEIAIYIDDTWTREQALAMQSGILAIPNIETAVFVSKEQAFDDYLLTLGDDAIIMDGLREDNPLRDSYKITMKDISLHAQTVEEIGNLQGVGGLQSRKDISDKLLQIKRVVNGVSITLIALLGSVSIFIISNTVKLAMFYRKDEIGIMKMVGATNTFIRAPFIVEGVCLGLMGSVLAFLAQMGVYQYIAKQLVASSGILATVSFGTFGVNLALIFLAAGVLFGTLGSVFTIQKFLKV